MQSQNRMFKAVLPGIKIHVFVVICLIIMLLFNLECKNRSTSKQLNEKLFVQIYCDVVVNADLIDAKRRGTFVDSVLMSYQISHQQLQNTVKYYSSDEEKWEKVFAGIVAELERREKEMTVESDSTRITTSDE